VGKRVWGLGKGSEADRGPVPILGVSKTVRVLVNLESIICVAVPVYH